MYKRIDRVVMGSPLGQGLAKNFAGFYETKFFSNANKPLMHQYYVDDTFVEFNSEKKSGDFFIFFNSLYPSSWFTFEKECNCSLLFQDFLVEKSEAEFINSVYRKPTFIGQYLCCNSLCSFKRKINLIDTLVHCVLMICSNSKLRSEQYNMRSIMLKNGYSNHVV